MSLKDIEIQPSYESDSGDLIQKFYEPVLSCCVKYYRLAGFFSSSSLAIAARGIASLIRNNGKYLLICNPLLSKEDAQALKNAVDTLPEDISLDLEKIESEIERNHVKAMGWMLAHGYLEIKLAVVYDDNGNPVTSDNISQYGIFHQKVGILCDTEGNSISFSGSINESATAWLKNDEEFKVFRSWDATKTFVDGDFKRFQAYWCNEKTKTKVYNIPDSLKHELISYSYDFEIENLAVRQYLFNEPTVPYTITERKQISLFEYQQKAVERWIENDFMLLFEMATGTGKTRTAIACINYLLSNVTNRLIIIISCPQSTLAQQWGKEIEALGVNTDQKIIVDSTNPKWHEHLESSLLEIENGFADSLLLLTTHASASKQRFTDLISRIANIVDVAFVGDETHWLGAGKLCNALLPSYKYRIGLSATPSRWFDDNGTKRIVEYYGNQNFEFGIYDALTTINPLTNKTFLVNYLYKLIDVKLNEDEGIEYQRLTHQLVRASVNRGKSEEAEERYQRLLMRRADLVKNADSKYDALDRLLHDLDKERAIQDLIIFVSPQQKDRVKEILNRHNILSHELTEKQGTTRKKEYGGLSEREHILSCFKNGRYKVLIAIKCLDEGIDIPTASRGILMASSTNPREYVQRIGRIIRQSSGKTRSYLYDLTVLGCDFLSDEEQKLDKRMREKEIVRIREIAKNALNAYDSETIINRYK